MDTLTKTLATICGADNIQTGAAVAGEYRRDFLGEYNGMPRAVVFPQNEGQVAKIVRACFDSHTPVVARGGNTGYAAAAVAEGEGKAVMIAMKKMRAIIKVDKRNRTLTAEAGCILEDARQAAAAAGLLFPLVLGAKGSCQLGGNLATNAGGLNVLRYGNCRDLCLGLRAVLPNGDIIGALSGLRKDNSGYDLRHLLIGSEGTLGIITSAVFKLFSSPAASGCAFCRVASANAAMDFFDMCRADLGDRLHAFELMPRLLFDLLAEHLPQIRPPFDNAPDYAVLFEFGAEDDAKAQAETEKLLARAMERGVIEDAVPAQNEAMRLAFWHAREATPEATKKAGKWIKMDVSLPISQLALFITTLEAQLPKISAGRYVIAFGHLGDGNLHISAMPDKKDDKTAAAICAEVYERVHRYGGSFSAEHGIGQSKTALLRQYKDAASVAAMRAVKNALDPRGIMNPGKVLATTE
ncbi:MAG: FAD-binding oxidoreductase [Gammaproteobacteria bacterium]